jgi:hypothetical protein
MHIFVADEPLLVEVAPLVHVSHVHEHGLIDF